MPSLSRGRRPSRPLAGLLAALWAGAACASAAPDLPEGLDPSPPAPAEAAVAVRLAAEGAGGLGPARVELGPGGRDLRLTGDLAAGVADRVAAVLAAHPGIARLHLTSEGGLVDEGLALGALVAAYGLATYVPRTCASACTLAFVRGRGRYLGARARLGFHGPFVTGFLEPGRAVDPASERAAYLNAGLSPDFVARALAGGPDAMWEPDAARLRAAGVVTAVVRAGRLPW